MTKRLVRACCGIEGGPTTAHMVFCPGCRQGHRFDVDRWSFDGNLEAPTFSPSMLVRQPGWVSIPRDRWVTIPTGPGSGIRAPRDLVGDDCPATLAGMAARLHTAVDLHQVELAIAAHLDALPDEVCHSFVRGGLIEYLPDSTHALRGTTVALVSF